jgi:hypothetical protein
VAEAALVAADSLVASTLAVAVVPTGLLAVALAPHQLSPPAASEQHRHTAVRILPPEVSEDQVPHLDSTMAAPE